MKYPPKDLFAGYDKGAPGGKSVVMIGLREEGRIKWLENIWPSDADVGESIANAINFTAETAQGRKR